MQYYTYQIGSNTQPRLHYYAQGGSTLQAAAAIKTTIVMKPHNYHNRNSVITSLEVVGCSLATPLPHTAYCMMVLLSVSLYLVAMSLFS